MFTMFLKIVYTSQFWGTEKTQQSWLRVSCERQLMKFSQFFIVPFTLHFMTQFKAEYRDMTSSFTASYQYCHIIFWLLPWSSYFMVITWQLSHSHFFFSSRYWKKISLSNFGCSNWLSISLELGTQLKWFHSCWSDQGQMAETYYAIE